MVLQILQRFFDGQMLSRKPGLRWDTKFGGIWGTTGMEGLSFKKSLENEGYAFLAAQKIDYTTWTFTSPYGDQMVFNDNSVLQSYRKQW